MIWIASCARNQRNDEIAQIDEIASLFDTNWLASHYQISGGVNFHAGR